MMRKCRRRRSMMKKSNDDECDQEWQSRHSLVVESRQKLALEIVVKAAVTKNMNGDLVGAGKRLLSTFE
jgi:hypothetical protein